MLQSALKNSFFSFILQACTIVFSYTIRILTLQNIGAEWLGISGTLLSIIGIFSLAELGIDIYIVYLLFDPIVHNDVKKINVIVNLCRTYYWCIIIVIAISSFALVFIIPLFINGIAMNIDIYILYFIYVAESIISYSLSYRKVLLEADQKQYIYSGMNLMFSLVCAVLQILLILCTGNFLCVAFVQLVKTLLLNITIFLCCGKHYPFLCKRRVDKRHFLEFFRNAKDVIGIKLASYIYCSTDNLVIAIFINTMCVAYYGNYLLVISSIKNLLRSILYPLNSSVGNAVARKSDVKKMLFHILSYSCILVLLLCVPTLILGDFFVSFAFGGQYVLEKEVLQLMVMDTVLDSLQIPLCIFIRSYGLFKKENLNCCIGAIINIAVSVILARPFGLNGILMGTVISQIVFLALRIYVLLRSEIIDIESSVWRLIVLFAKFTIVFALTTYIGSGMVNSIVFEDNLWMEFFVDGILLEFLLVGASFLFFWKDIKNSKISVLFLAKENADKNRWE